MSYQDGLDALSRSKTVVVELKLDSQIVGTGGSDFIAMGDTDPQSNYYPCVDKIDWVPSRVDPNGGLGYFGDIVITAKDFPYNQGNPALGTFFGRMIGANTYYLNRIIDVHVGFWNGVETFDLSNFQTRRYFLKRIDGPTDRGIVKFYASDVISRLEESEIPAATNGNLNAALAAATTGTVNITDNDGFSASGGYAIVNDEIVAYSGISGADSIIISTRAQGGTVAEDHDADDPVRNIYQSTGNVIDEVRTIIEDFTDIDDASYIPDTDWNTERDTFLSGDNVELWITEPKKVSDLIDEIGKQTFINWWWDDAAQEIKVKAIGPTLTAATEWNDDDHILDSRAQVKRDQKKVLTAYWYYFNKLNKAEDNDAENFETVLIDVRTAVETALGEERTEKIYAEYINASGTASKVASRILDQREEPIELTCMVDAKDSIVNIGDAVLINSSLIQDATGANRPVIMRVIERAERNDNQYFYKLIRTGQETGDRYFVWAPDSIGVYSGESDANKDVYGWWADADPDVEGDDPYLWQ